MQIPQITTTKTAQMGEMGQQYLATGKKVALRRWEENACEFGEPHSRDYETVGYVVSGTLELDLDGEVVKIKSGGSWLVPAGAEHRYRIVEKIVAIEATSPPARFNELDEPVSNSDKSSEKSQSSGKPYSTSPNHEAMPIPTGTMAEQTDDAKEI